MPNVLGIFGGTFDPVHFGHLRLAEEARQHLGLARVRWIPAGQPRHRESPQVAGADRLAMVRLALAGNSFFDLDAAEVESESPSYTVPTLERLRQELGARRPLVLLLGADAFAGLSTWHRWQELIGLAHIAIAHRPGYAIETAGLPAEVAGLLSAARIDDPERLAGRPAGNIVAFAMTPLAISATAIRALLQAGESTRYLLPDGVIDYIARHRLYRGR